MLLTDIGMIAADTSRTKMYLQILVHSQLIPNHVLVLVNNSNQLPGQNDASTEGGKKIAPLHSVSDAMESFVFDPYEPIIDTLCRANISYECIENTDINSEICIEKIHKRSESTLIYSGFGGAILRAKVLDTKKYFLHVHGGYLPDYKGSTTNYYSIIDQDNCGASAIFLEKEIDCGPILWREKYPTLNNKLEIDHIYDSAIRADVLVKTLKRYSQEKVWSFITKDNKGGDVYYVIHPLLKHIAILC